MPPMTPSVPPLGALGGVPAALVALAVPYGRDGLAAAADFFIARAASGTSAGPR